MAIDSEKILTVSLSDWTRIIKGKEGLSDYTLQGVQAAAYVSTGGGEDGITEAFAKKVPDNAEVVVDYRCSTCGWYGAKAYASGTALIPEEK